MWDENDQSTSYACNIIIKVLTMYDNIYQLKFKNKYIYVYITETYFKSYSRELHKVKLRKSYY
jgi:hypothetical protein